MSDEQKPSKKIVAPTLSSQELEQAVMTTKEWLDKEPKFTIRIRKDTDPKAPNYETVQINGYTFTIMKGKDVEVPKTVRDILMEANII